MKMLKNLAEIRPQVIFCVFVYNIIFGSGVLFLPLAFWYVGYILGTILLCLLTFLSWASCVFVVESLSLANVKQKLTSIANTANDTCQLDQNLESNEDTVEKAITSPSNLEKDMGDADDGTVKIFAIDNKFEVAQLAKSFFGQGMLIFFYAIMIGYLYGDLCIYLSVVGSTLKDLSCPVKSNRTSIMMDFCHKAGVNNIFRIYVSAFFLLTAPFIFTNIRKSIFVQIITMVMRLIAIIIMVTFASIRISNNAKHDIVPFQVDGIPRFFGVGLYSFMCQHSIPSMVNYVTNKNSRFGYLILISMSISLILYIVVVFTATMAFTGDQLFPIYSTNFDNPGAGVIYDIFYYYLMVFPTLALAGSFPIVGITLRENLISLTEIALKREVQKMSKAVLFPLLAIIPSYIVTMLLPDSVSELAGYVGTYGGSFVQYFIPACLVLSARRTIKRDFPNTDITKSRHHSVLLGNSVAPIFVIIWTFVGISIVTYYKIKLG